ncbi:hypothetical protein B0H66DRAFT_585157 [Apodospora peruviana]|uniref:Tat pathway signal sequence n=1 Tax=Apodospora peruviana TaxID=516989 RepID=A0AAE0LYM7_9PEZI|nr:hypothetical protein B0H66DRAFT_585157 [Apodospora peruviana]
MSPREFLKYVEQPEWESPRYPWNSGPSDALDAAWRDLLNAINIQVTPTEMDSVGENRTNRVRIENGNYIGALGVYHHLHCLNNLRRVIHWDYYEPQLREVEHPEGFWKEHSATDHCIDVIRQAIMCHANMAVYVLEWADDARLRVSTDLRSDARVTCANWDVLDNWARQRAVVAGRDHYLHAPVGSKVLEP